MLFIFRCRIDSVFYVSEQCCVWGAPIYKNDRIFFDFVVNGVFALTCSLGNDDGTDDDDSVCNDDARSPFLLMLLLLLWLSSSTSVQ